MTMMSATTISNTHFCIRQTVDRKILSELSMNEVVSPEMALPIPIGIQLIDKYGSTFAAVTIQVTLAVTVQVETACHPRPFDRRFPNAGVHRFALPNDVARQTNIDRNQSSHHSGPYKAGKMAQTGST